MYLYFKCFILLFDKWPKSQSLSHILTQFVKKNLRCPRHLKLDSVHAMKD